MKHLVVLLFLAFLVAGGSCSNSTVVADIPIYTRFCSLCRVYGKNFSCVKFTNTYTLCKGLFFSDDDTCVLRSGYFTASPVRGCFIF